jgi:hypothetical protein
MHSLCINTLRSSCACSMPAVVSITLRQRGCGAPFFYGYLKEFGSSGPARLAIELIAVPVRDASEIEAGIARLTPDGGLIVAPNPFTVVNRELIIRSLERHRLPAMSGVFSNPCVTNIRINGLTTAM